MTTSSFHEGLATLLALALTLWGALGLLADHRADRRMTAADGAAGLPDLPPRRVEAGTFDALYGDPGPYTRTPGGKR